MSNVYSDGLVRLALGSNCPECGSSTDEPCRTRRTRAEKSTPHVRRIDRAVKQHQERNEK